MPVTARLSRKFYERFGDEIAGELVDWFNAVDLSYQTQLKEINELNWERFKAALQAEGTAIRAELREEFRVGLADLRGELSSGLADLGGKLRSGVAEVRGEVRSGLGDATGESRGGLAQLRTEMAAMRADLLKWMFIYWTGTVVSLGALIVGMGIFGPR